MTAVATGGHELASHTSTILGLQAKGLHGHAKRNHARSVVLFAVFMLAVQVVGGIVMTLPLLVHAAGAGGSDTPFLLVDPLGYFADWGLPVGLVGLAVFAWRLRAFRAGLDARVAARPATLSESRRLEPLLGPLAIMAGVREPVLGVIDSPTRNAFAAGTDERPRLYVTTGLIQALTNAELRAVFAHEIAHIAHGDLRFMAIANASLGTVEAMARANPLSLKKDIRLILFILVPIFLLTALIFAVLEAVMLDISRITRLTILSSREFIADADAVRLTHDPDALVRALRKTDGETPPRRLGTMVAAMMINGATIGPYATHPVTEARVEALQRHADQLIRQPELAVPSPGLLAGLRRLADRSAARRINAVDSQQGGGRHKLLPFLLLALGVILVARGCSYALERTLIAELGPVSSSFSETETEAGPLPESLRARLRPAPQP